MIFWASVEAEGDAYEPYVEVSRPAEEWFNERFADSPLADIELELRYIPIVMGKILREWKYKARSRAEIKKRVYNCCPQLDYVTFLSGSLEARAEEYVRGLRETTAQLRKFGATKEQAAAFDAILDEAPTAIAERARRKSLH